MANGWLSFGADNETTYNQSVFDNNSPKPAIFAFWDDLNPENLATNGQGTIKYHSNNERTVIWYDNIAHVSNNNDVYDFQIVLYPSGKVAINYKQMNGSTNSATVGIIDQNGNYGLEPVYNENGFFQNEMSVLFDTAPSWINILSNDFGQIPENETLSIEFNVTTENLENNSYQSFIFINSNANVESSIIPVMLTVSENGLLLGDLNQDEIIDILDVVRLVSIVLGQYTPTSFESLLADLNQDDIINVQDIVLMINIILSE